MKIGNINIPSIYLVLVLISLVLFGLIEWLNPKEASWQTTYSSKDKMPYGTFVLYNQLQDLFPGKSIEKNSTNYFELLHSTSMRKTLLIVNDDFYTDESSVNAILNYASEGNEVFISARNITAYLEDTLGFQMESAFPDLGRTNQLTLVGDTTVSKLESAVNAEFYDCFSEPDEENEFEILGRYDGKEINFIKINFGDGAIYLHATPLAFTNFYILNGNTTGYVEKVFSLLELNDVIWDDYIRQKKYMNSSDLMFITSNPALRAAFNISIVLLLLFMVFYGKRRQRVISVVEPLKNSSLDFADTISKLYLQQHKHKNIAEKQIRYFNDYVRLHFHLQPGLKSGQFTSKLASRSGKDEYEINELLDYLHSFDGKKLVSANELLELNMKIENFKKNK